MANFKNLRYCEVLHEGKYYDVMIGVTDLDEVNNVLQEWALAKFGVNIDLPTALTKNLDIKEVVTSKNIDEYVYVQGAVSSYMDMPKYAGISGGEPILPKILVNSKYVVPALSVFLYSLPEFSGVFGEYSIEATELTLIDDEINYIGVDYTLGEPVVNVYANDTFFNYSSIIPICKILSMDTELNVTPYGMLGDGLSERLFVKSKDFKIDGNFDFSSNALNVEVGAFDVVNGASIIETPAIETDTVDNDMWLYYINGTGVDWEKSENPEINNTQFQGLTGLETLASGKFVINYIYKVIDDTNKLLFNVLSGSFDSLALAKESANLKTLPDNIVNGAVLVGRIIVEKDSVLPLAQEIQNVIFV